MTRFLAGPELIIFSCHQLLCVNRKLIAASQNNHLLESQVLGAASRNEEIALFLNPSCWFSMQNVKLKGSTKSFRFATLYKFRFLLPLQTAVNATVQAGKVILTELDSGRRTRVIFKGYCNTKKV